MSEINNWIAEYCDARSNEMGTIGGYYQNLKHNLTVENFS